MTYWEIMTCWWCGSKEVQAINSADKSETACPYKIFMCLKCDHVFYKYEDEIKKL